MSDICVLYLVILHHNLDIRYEYSSHPSYKTIHSAIKKNDVRDVTSSYRGTMW